MRIKVLSLIGFIFCFNTLCYAVAPADRVDMFMGVYGRSSCVIGPQLPHGSTNPSPQTPKGGHDGYDPAQPIRGFGQLHVSGTGWGRYGQVFLSPQVGFDPSEGGHDSPKSDEKATPYYYGVTLDRYGIRTEITPTHHCAVYRMTFPGGDDQHILLDIAHNLTQHIVPFVGGRFQGGEIRYDARESLLTGFGRYYGGFGSKLPYEVYFAVKLNVAPSEVKISDGGEKSLYAQISLPDGVKHVRLDVGISLKNSGNALAFLEKETVGRSFDAICADAKGIWNRTLGKIRIGGVSPEQEKLFYTSLYHSHVMPRDRTGDNPRWESDMPHLDDHYCVWDTWRTKYPLMILLEESYVARTVNSFIDRYAHNGMCQPTFTSSWDGPKKQGGDDVDNVIADAMVKGVKGFDPLRAYELIKYHAFSGRSGDYLRLGWQPETGAIMSCSYEMEYAYNDFCAAEVAAMVGDAEHAELLRKRSRNWDRIFNPELESRGFKGFIAPRRENGEWIDIDPAKHYGSWLEYIYEGNSWIYTLFVPHDFERLISLCGGPERMAERLYYGFDNRLINLTNEPGFLSPFIFHHCGRPDLTARYVHRLREKDFSLTRGYPDNEDSGAMGAWYVFTSMGLFPNAGQDLYYLFTPGIPEAVLTMENGGKLVVKAPGLSAERNEVDYITLDGRRLEHPWLRHGDIARGAEIVFHLKKVRPKR